MSCSNKLQVIYIYIHRQNLLGMFKITLRVPLQKNGWGTLTLMMTRDIGGSLSR